MIAYGYWVVLWELVSPMNLNFSKFRFLLIFDESDKALSVLFIKDFVIHQRGFLFSTFGP